ncbi:MAG TPA: dihydropteroate synthase [Verrucomicrobiae bacterium]|jgi:dihydropteroate synthase
MLFCARQFKFKFPRPALIMGIVNITPDSFSDGGKFLRPGAAVAHAFRLVEQGAEILDIGGESTRPGAAPVSEREELRRVLPLLKSLAGRVNIPLSIDTMKPAVARAALEAGASIVNDVAANRGDSKMWEVVSEFRAGYICMHAPPALHRARKQSKIVVEVGNFFAERMKKLRVAGILPEQVVFDPGIGFGKTPGQNLRLLAELRRLTKLNRPLLLGVSRKSFIEKIVGGNVNERLPASLACAILGVESGAQIIRAHDVAETIQAVRMVEAILDTAKNDR